MPPQSTALASVAVLVLTSLATAQLPPNAFDLADACRGGDGSFPGTGSNDGYSVNPGAFVPATAYPFVVGTFALQDIGPTFITDPSGPNPIQFDFGPHVGATQNNGGPANGLHQGGLAINDPSNLAGNPDYTGDPNNHSIMMCHGSIGITFDLNAIRASFPNANWFVANAGSSCNPTGYVVLVDGELRAANGGNSGSNFHAVQVPIPATAQYLTLASTDNNLGTINCAHGFFGDPWLVPAPAGPAYGSIGGGCANPATGIPMLTNQVGSAPALGSTLTLEMTNTPAASGIMIVTFGLANVTIPLPMSILQVPNCATVVTPDFIDFSVYLNGVGTYNFAIPANPGLAGFSWFNQAAAFDPVGADDALSNANVAIVQ